jgi:hypothetical protein
VYLNLPNAKGFFKRSRRKEALTLSRKRNTCLRQRKFQIAGKKRQRDHESIVQEEALASQAANALVVCHPRLLRMSLAITNGLSMANASKYHQRLK